MLSLVEEWGTKSSANVHQLWALLGKLLHLAVLLIGQAVLE